MSSIFILNYGLGNLRSISKALERIESEVKNPSNPQKVMVPEKSGRNRFKLSSNFVRLTGA